MENKRGSFYRIPATIQNLTQREYAEGARLALENAECHLSISRQIANTKNYGMAISHLVLSSEELAKAAILKIRSYNEGIRIKNLADYFRDHEVKHLMNSRIVMIAIFKNFADESKDTKTTSKDKFLIVLLLVLVVVAVIAAGRKGVTGEIHKMSELRNQGFYVDYDSVRKMWLTPAITHNEEKWKETEQVVLLSIDFLKRTLFSNNIARKDIREFIESLADENIVAPDLKAGLEELRESIS